MLHANEISLFWGEKRTFFFLILCKNYQRHWNYLLLMQDVWVYAIIWLVKLVYHRYLLTNQSRPRSINDIMPMIGARFYTQLDSAQLRSDVIENELTKVNTDFVLSLMLIVENICKTLQWNPSLMVWNIYKKNIFLVSLIIKIIHNIVALVFECLIISCKYCIFRRLKMDVYSAYWPS